MRLLVLSDSHGDTFTLRKAIMQNSSADAVIFLGDGIHDWEYVTESPTNKTLIAVRGNCDFYANRYPLKAIEEFDGVRVYCTHGHSETVKYSTDMLKEKTRECGATIALYGHTHTAKSEYDDGLYIMNPGSVRDNSCGIVDITPKGIICYTKPIVTN